MIKSAINIVVFTAFSVISSSFSHAAQIEISPNPSKIISPKYISTLDNGGHLGIKFRMDDTLSIKGTDYRGFIVEEVHDYSKSKNILMPEDIIISINDIALTDNNDFIRLIKHSKPGSSIIIYLIRENKYRTVAVNTMKAPANITAHKSNEPTVTRPAPPALTQKPTSEPITTATILQSGSTRNERPKACSRISSFCSKLSLEATACGLVGQAALDGSTSDAGTLGGAASSAACAALVGELNEFDIDWVDLGLAAVGGAAASDAQTAFKDGRLIDGLLSSLVAVTTSGISHSKCTSTLRKACR